MHGDALHGLYFIRRKRDGSLSPKIVVCAEDETLTDGDTAIAFGFVDSFYFV
jgi:hypothetical protein